MVKISTGTVGKDCETGDIPESQNKPVHSNVTRNIRINVAVMLIGAAVTVSVLVACVVSIAPLVSKRTLQGKTPKACHVDDRDISEYITNQSDTIKIRIPDKATFVYDLKNQLQVVNFDSSRDICWVMQLNRTYNSNDFSVSDTQDLQAFRAVDVDTVWFTLTDVTVDPDLLIPSLKSTCTKFYWMLHDNTEKVMRRKRRSCGQSCMYVCTSINNCQLRCYKNLCRPSGPIVV